MMMAQQQQQQRQGQMGPGMQAANQMMGGALQNPAPMGSMIPQGPLGAGGGMRPAAPMMPQQPQANTGQALQGLAQAMQTLQGPPPGQQGAGQQGMGQQGQIPLAALLQRIGNGAGGMFQRGGWFGGPQQNQALATGTAPVMPVQQQPLPTVDPNYTGG